MHAYNPSTQEVETGESRVEDQAGLHSKSVSKMKKQTERKREGEHE
jgi:hypothetical protein